jgi:hypothetical protein
MNHGNIAGAVKVRMGIRLRRLPVRCPPGVANAELTAELWRRFFQRLYSDGIFTYLNARVRYGYAAGVITTVLEPHQAVEEDGLSLLIANITYDATHDLKDQAPVR